MGTRGCGAGGHHKPAAGRCESQRRQGIAVVQIDARQPPRQSFEHAQHSAGQQRHRDRMADLAGAFVSPVIVVDAHADYLAMGGFGG